MFGLFKKQSAKKRPARSAPPQPNHVPGVAKGEELSLEEKEPGRGGKGERSYRTARDSTGINANLRRPIHPDMPDIPPV